MKDKKYYESLDKRTKEYKEYVKQSKGLGDDIEKLLTKTGIKKVVDTFTGGKDCGCDERKRILNNMFPKRVKAVRCMTDEQIISYKNYIDSRTLNLWNKEEVKYYIDLYAWVFAIKYNQKDLCANCSGSAKILLRITSQLDKVYNSYNKK